MTPRDEAPFLAALQRWGTHPVQISATVCDLQIIASAIHLALRHPHFPATSRYFLDRLLAQWAETLDRVDPVLGACLRLGSDPAYDVPVEDTP